ncbi:expressed unknown protein [Seminavis robusta]|uniref:Uncharacterized protein n=1 Tax=Seminavis robusta TaxID=568900 RepID=A0A9N8DMW2_9STRA|nr:expressed unknown protein [Seminavis robusta]|eukprot:Sro171_g075820.1 n/a (136) ;mRNA; r:71173-71580
MMPDVDSNDASNSISNDDDAPLQKDLMKISQTELDRAMEIKAAFQNDGRLREIPSDFMCVQYALCSADESLAQVCERAYPVQCFQEEYKIADTLEEGIDFPPIYVTAPWSISAMEYLLNSKAILLSWILQLSFLQ